VIARAERVIEAHDERETAGETMADMRSPSLLDDDFASSYGKGN
jgi:hypothetical protein